MFIPYAKSRLLLKLDARDRIRAVLQVIAGRLT